VPVREVGYAVDIDAGQKPARRLYRVVADLKRSGRLRHVGVGLYLPAGRAATGGRPDEDGRARMWRALRLRHKRGQGVQIADLARLAGVGPAYAKEFLATLCRRGIVSRIGRRLPATYRLAQDPVEMPAMAENAEKLRRLRRHRALVEINEARAALERAVEHLEGSDEADA
ncbi:hypothetical protein, partial [Mycolicibacterium sp.]|uniref:hypothetical protein n=1 Tax=Mycolicibacterium sp. TaxID=2320850 RepID=UPI00355FCA74